MTCVPPVWTKRGLLKTMVQSPFGITDVLDLRMVEVNLDSQMSGKNKLKDFNIIVHLDKQY